MFIELLDDANTTCSIFKKNNSIYTCFILVIQHFIDKNKLFKRKYYFFFIKIAYYTHMGQAITIQKHANI